MLVTWDAWTPEDTRKQPSRVCAVAGCKNSPHRVKSTTKNEKTRRHAYCVQHALDLESK